MVDRPAESLTLRERFSVAERSLRELTDHIERGFLPKLHELYRLVQPTRTGGFDVNVEDVTVRNHVASVLESENYTEKVASKLEEFCRAIDSSAGRIVTEG